MPNNREEVENNKGHHEFRNYDAQESDECRDIVAEFILIGCRVNPQQNTDRLTQN